MKNSNDVPITSANTTFNQNYLNYDSSHIFSDDYFLYDTSFSQTMSTQIDKINNTREYSDAKMSSLEVPTNDNKINNMSLNCLSEQMKKEPSYVFTHDKEFDFLMNTPRKKSTSLKVRKPLGEESEKKVVRFSDALGLELTSTRHVFNSDEPPCVPYSAMRDLNLNVEVPFNNFKEVKKLGICFSSPENCPDFVKRVQERKVLLENCSVDDSNNSVYGSIRVMNLAFEKEVKMRYSFNNWITHDELFAFFESSIANGSTDRFTYSIRLPDSFGISNSLQFSIKYSVNQQTFWDNNYGSNYTVECYISSKFY